MFKLPKVENSSYYIDQAMKGMQEFALNERDKISERFKKSASTQKKDAEIVKLDKRKDLELQKIRFLNDRLNQSLRKVTKKYPKFRSVDKIYIDLINTSETPVKKIEASIKDINYMADTIDNFSQKSEHKIKKAKTHETIGFIMKKHLGKVNSLFSKNKEPFKVLDMASKFMSKLPKFQDLYTVSIAGFPNVGKSTLMKKMTGSNVEIQNYPFTTKGLMFGYLNFNSKKAIQLIDTPGLLNRDKNNSIEERAKIVITDFCEKIVFVIDFTQSCGYSIDEQMKLLKNTSKLDKQILIYLSKTDIYEEIDEELFDEYKNKLKKYKQFSDSNELKNELIEFYKKSLTKFDPNKVKLIK